MLVGLSFARSSTRSGATRLATLAGYALAIVRRAVVVTRIAGSSPCPTSSARSTAARASARGAPPPRRGSWSAWSGMRGAVSLAAALAHPAHDRPGRPFPERDLIIFLTFAVIFFTLVVQGLTLPALIRASASPATAARRRRRSAPGWSPPRPRSHGSTSSAEEEWTRDETIERMRALYEYRIRRFAARAGKIEDDGYEDRSLAYQQTVQIVLAAQREALIQNAKRRRPLERGDEPRHPRLRPRGVAARDLIRASAAGSGPDSSPPMSWLTSGESSAKISSASPLATIRPSWITAT